jgi:hypothetical protein
VPLAQGFLVSRILFQTENGMIHESEAWPSVKTGHNRCPI